MTNRLSPVVIATFFLMSSLSQAADLPEHWQAASTTASSITGDITVSVDQITFSNGTSLRLDGAEQLTNFIGMDEKVTATLYRIVNPTDPLLNNGNHLCGGHALPPATFIAIWRPAPIDADIDPRALAVFSGTTPPRSDSDLSACGTFSYEAGKTP